MGLNSDNRYMLNRMNSVAQKSQMGTLLERTKNHVTAVYDFAVLGGAVSTLALKDLDGNTCTLQSGAIITNVIAHVVTACTSGGSATVSLGANTTTDLMGATAVASLSLNALLAGVPVGTAATAVRLTADRNISVAIAVAALTAGKVNYHIEYILANPAS